MTRLLFFGRLRDVAGQAERIVHLPRQLRTLTELCAWIRHDDAELGAALQAPGVRIAIDQVISSRADEGVQGAREIAFMPPLSGG